MSARRLDIGDDIQQREVRMLTVTDYARIRLAHRNGKSIWEIARTQHHSRRKVREVVAEGNV